MQLLILNYWIALFLFGYYQYQCYRLFYNTIISESRVNIIQTKTYAALSMLCPLLYLWSYLNPAKTFFSIPDQHCFDVDTNKICLFTLPQHQLTSNCLEYMQFYRLPTVSDMTVTRFINWENEHRDVRLLTNEQLFRFSFLQNFTFNKIKSNATNLCFFAI